MPSFLMPFSFRHDACYFVFAFMPCRASSLFDTLDACRRLPRRYADDIFPPYAITLPLMSYFRAMPRRLSHIFDAPRRFRR